METADSFDDCVTCPEGYICPRKTGDRYAIPCPAGYYCPLGTGYPISCPFGYYCQGTGPDKIDMNDCPEGSFCPVGTIIPQPCEDNLDYCPWHGLDCPPGKWLKWEGIWYCEFCEAGFVCDGSTTQRYPIDIIEEGGYVCPPGYYCPPGSSTQTMK